MLWLCELSRAYFLAIEPSLQEQRLPDVSSTMLYVHFLESSIIDLIYMLQVLGKIQGGLPENQRENL